ncbi:tripartite tricarboxylate transporter substrate binding protein [Psychromarinibacter sp. C21-152]|uniref:Tripartite tricarboxylate transporter substrate binding protein n=1 Tax=Psychromarinibacter sediminicola TaxID=3033385 RepID=A0AAE3NQZ5_9RHOB|nr:tripartite tricarboxylate transporter substrate binding protein [Psychromarinibacter sediminicola]MDF0600461.1 tripartite tricarboxylate transporter substrate binding protein [Psychromarinibacter sediminicola]
MSHTINLTRRAAIALAAGLAALAAPAAAQDWPERPVTLVVPYGPGASNDTFTRALADILTQTKDQPFVVENRAGAGGFTGAKSVVDAEPDGYTFLEIPNSVVGFKPLMKVDLDPLEDLKPVGLLARAPTAMVVPASLGVDTVAEFIEHAKANPDSTFYGAAGIGTTQQQHAELFNQNTGLSLLPVNYKSSSDAQTDLIAGRLDVMFVTVASTLGQIESGQLKLLAYSDDNYPDSAPDAPTLAEEGVEGMDIAQIFWAVFAPAGTPDEIVGAMNDAINEALQDEDYADLMAKSGATPAPGEPEALTQVLMDEKKLVEDFLKLGLME